MIDVNNSALLSDDEYEAMINDHMIRVYKYRLSFLNEIKLLLGVQCLKSELMIHVEDVMAIGYKGDIPAQKLARLFVKKYSRKINPPRDQFDIQDLHNGCFLSESLTIESHLNKQFIDLKNTFKMWIANDNCSYISEIDQKGVYAGFHEGMEQCIKIGCTENFSRRKKGYTYFVIDFACTS